jgi:hypothetical protein
MQSLAQVMVSHLPPHQTLMELESLLRSHFEGVLSRLPTTGTSPSDDEGYEGTNLNSNPSRSRRLRVYSAPMPLSSGGLATLTFAETGSGRESASIAGAGIAIGHHPRPENLGRQGMYCIMC